MTTVSTEERLARLEAGQEHLATKEDIARLESRQDSMSANMATKEDIARLESRQDSMATKEDVAHLETRIIKWMVGLMTGSIVAATALATLIERIT